MGRTLAVLWSLFSPLCRRCTKSDILVNSNHKERSFDSVGFLLEEALGNGNTVTYATSTDDTNTLLPCTQLPSFNSMPRMHWFKCRTHYPFSHSYSTLFSCAKSRCMGTAKSGHGCLSLVMLYCVVLHFLIQLFSQKCNLQNWSIRSFYCLTSRQFFLMSNVRTIVNAC